MGIGKTKKEISKWPALQFAIEVWFSLKSLSSAIFFHDWFSTDNFHQIMQKKKNTNIYLQIIFIECCRHPGKANALTEFMHLNEAFVEIVRWSGKTILHIFYFNFGAWTMNVDLQGLWVAGNAIWQWGSWGGKCAPKVRRICPWKGV